MTTLTERLNDLRSADVLDYPTYSELHDLAAEGEAALALMRAVQPEDETDELVHCERVADAIPGVGSWETRIAIRAAIHEERASARAETAAEVERLRGKVEELRAAIDSAITALGTYEGQGGTGESVAADLRAALEETK